MMIFRNPLAVILLLACLAGTSCRKDFPATGWVDEELFSIGSYLEDQKSQNRFTRFLALLEETNTLDAMKAINPEATGYTLFLPEDWAFDPFLESSDKYRTFEDLLADTAFCMDLIRFQVVLNEYRLSELPIGGIPDRTLSGDYLTIGFKITEDSAIYLVNNTAVIIDPDIEMTNGIIHITDHLLVPVQTRSYEWLANHPDCRIFAELLESTGIHEQMTNGNYTILAEQDSVYHMAGIFSLDDLRDRLAAASVVPPGDPEDDLYRFAAYHVLRGIYFLDRFQSRNYPTLTSSPVNIEVDFDVRINPGLDTFDFQVSGSDTIYQDWINPYYLESNISTKNGAIHFVDQVMEYRVPRLSSQDFNFYHASNPYPLNANQGENQEVRFVDPGEFTYLDWTSSDGELWYVRDDILGNGASARDYIKFEGDFRIDFEIPTVLLPGQYEMYLYAKTGINENFAIIEVLLDGIKVGTNINLASESSRGSNPFDRISVGSVAIESYSNHIVTIQSVIDGTFIWDYIRFEPY